MCHQYRNNTPHRKYSMCMTLKFEGGVGPSKHNCLTIVFISLTMTTCFGRACKRVVSFTPSIPHQAAIGTLRAIPPELLTLKTTTPDLTTKPATTDLPTLHASPQPPHTHTPHTIKHKTPTRTAPFKRTRNRKTSINSHISISKHK
jgi:hypothetical protein